MKKFKVIYGMVSLSYLVLGLVLLFYPGFSLGTLCYVFGILTLVYGVFHIVVYFIKDGISSLLRFDLALGIVAVAVSVWILIKPAGILGKLPVILGIFIVLSALMKLQYSLDLRKMGFERWWAVLLMAFFCLALGGVLILNPFGTQELFAGFAGVVMAVDGIAGIWTIICVTRQMSRLKREGDKLPEEKEEIKQWEIPREGIPLELDIESLPEEEQVSYDLSSVINDEETGVTGNIHPEKKDEKDEIT